MAKRSKAKRQVWERTLWAIQKADGTLEVNLHGTPFLVPTRSSAQCWAKPGEKPVKVRERIEVLG